MANLTPESTRSLLSVAEQHRMQDHYDLFSKMRGIPVWEQHNVLLQISQEAAQAKPTPGVLPCYMSCSSKHMYLPFIERWAGRQEKAFQQ
jgi:hypothetical protein